MEPDLFTLVKPCTLRVTASRQVNVGGRPTTYMDRSLMSTLCPHSGAFFHSLIKQRLIITAH